MTKEESLYQVKLIIDNLPNEEYNKIPREIIKYIEENMQYSDNIVIIPDIPLEKQKIDKKTYDFLNKIIERIEEDTRLNNINKKQLLELLEKYKSENAKISKAKDIIIDYKEQIKNKEDEIKNLKSINNELYTSIMKCPFIIRKLFFKNFDNKLLK